jgi:large subunit ribosomal protein L4
MTTKLKLVGGSGELQVSEATFGGRFNEALVHQVVTAYRNAGRSGTKAQKTRAEVRGGGRAFAAKPRSFEQKVNRKMYRGAIRAMLSELARQDRIVATDGIALEAPKTRLLANQLKSWSLGSVLIVVEATDEKLFLAARNLPHVEVIEAAALNPLALASYDKVLMTVGAVKLIEERLQ